MAEKQFKLPIYFDFSHFTSIIQVQYKWWRAIVECALVMLIKCADILSFIYLTSSLLLYVKFCTFLSDSHDHHY